MRLWYENRHCLCHTEITLVKAQALGETLHSAFRLSPFVQSRIFALNVFEVLRWTVTRYEHGTSLFACVASAGNLCAWL